MAKEPNFESIYKRYDLGDGAPRGALDIVTLSHAVEDAGEAGRLLSYLRSLGLMPTELDALYHAIAELDAEEELSAFRCREGIAVAHASDGWWILFIND